MDSTLKNKLKSYGSLAAALTTASAAQAAIQYNDIDDVVLGVDSGFVALDINNDGVADLGMGVFSATSFGLTVAALGGFGNVEFEGDQGSLGGYTFYQPYVQNTGANIGTGLPWLENTTSSAQFVLAGEADLAPPAPPAEFGHWKGETQKFMAFRIENCGVQNYGWIRMTVGSDYTITIHDFAIEDNGSAILAGNTGSGISPVTAATNVTADDQTDNLNAGDIFVSFTAASVSDELEIEEYRIYLQELDFGGENCFKTATELLALSADRYVTVAKGADYADVLPKDLLDADGNNIRTGRAYAVSVMSVPTTASGKNPGMAGGFESFVFMEAAFNGPAANDAADNYNASDLEASFTPVSIDDNIVEYRALVVPTSDTLSLAQAQAVAMGNYTAVPTPSTQTTTTVNFATDAKDINGDAIALNTPYQVYMLVVTDNDNDLLSPASNAVVLDDATSIQDVAALRAAVNMYSYSNTIVMNASNEVLGAEIRVVDLLGQTVVNTNLSSTNQSITLSNVSNGLYLVSVSHNGATTTEKVFIQQ